MILETTLKNEKVTYSRALRGMTVQEIESESYMMLMKEIGHKEMEGYIMLLDLKY